MLCLTRRPMESVTVIVPPSSEPTPVVFTILNRPHRVGVQAPRNASITRTELLTAGVDTPKPRVNRGEED